VATTVGGIRMPCDDGSRWHRFAFTEEDIGKTVIVTELTTDSNKLLFSIDNVRRTEVSKSYYNTSIYSSSFIICSVEEILNGIIEIGDDCDIEITNQEIELTHQDIGYLLLNDTNYNNFT
jgi:hypothetical protein